MGIASHPRCLVPNSRQTHSQSEGQPTTHVLVRVLGLLCWLTCLMRNFLAGPFFATSTRPLQCDTRSVRPCVVRHQQRHHTLFIMQNRGEKQKKNIFIPRSHAAVDKVCAHSIARQPPAWIRIRETPTQKSISERFVACIVDSWSTSYLEGSFCSVVTKARDAVPVSPSQAVLSAASHSLRCGFNTYE